MRSNGHIIPIILILTVYCAKQRELSEVSRFNARKKENVRFPPRKNENIRSNPRKNANVGFTPQKNENIRFTKRKNKNVTIAMTLASTTTMLTMMTTAINTTTMSAMMTATRTATMLTIMKTAMDTRTMPKKAMTTNTMIGNISQYNTTTLSLLRQVNGMKSKSSYTKGKTTQMILIVGAIAGAIICLIIFSLTFFEA
ncbi:putative integral membrane protein [Acanthocheilonema viteae]